MKRSILSVVFVVLFLAQAIGQQGSEGPPKQLTAPRQISSGNQAAPVTKVPSSDKAKTKSDQITAKLKLNEAQAVSVYNIISQTDKRIEDLEVGTENYGKLAGYINEERNEMLKAALSPEQFREYQKLYASKDMADMSKLAAKNNSVVAKKKAAEEKEKKASDALMKKEKEKQIQLEKKAKEADKKAAEKLKAQEKKALAKQKAETDKEANKQKALAKKEAEKAKAADKKAKETAKKEAEKQKALDKKLEAQRKALEKKK